MAIAISNKQILGTLTISNRKFLLNDKVINAYEIGDSYIKKGIYKKYEPEIFLKNKNRFINKSVFGRMVNDLLEKVSENNLIYGTPNNESKNGYIKHLNFNTFNYSNIYNYVSPSVSSFFNIYRIFILLF